MVTLSKARYWVVFLKTIFDPTHTFQLVRTSCNKFSLARNNKAYNNSDVWLHYAQIKSNQNTLNFFWFWSRLMFYFSRKEKPNYHEILNITKDFWERDRRRKIVGSDSAKSELFIDEKKCLFDQSMDLVIFQWRFMP